MGVGRLGFAPKPLILCLMSQIRSEGGLFLQLDSILVNLFEYKYRGQYWKINGLQSRCF